MILILGSVSVFGEITNSVHIYAGWNLISLNTAGLNPDLGKVYVLDVFSKEYIPINLKDFRKSWSEIECEGKPGNFLCNCNEDKFCNLLENLFNHLSEGDNLAVWVYSKKDKTILHDGSYVGDIDKYFLAKGWNLIGLDMRMNKKYLDDFKGTCNVEKLYAFDAVDQQWANLEIFIEGEDDFNEGEIGMGLAVKVSNDCKFDFTGSSNVLGIPSLPSDGETESDLQNIYNIVDGKAEANENFFPMNIQDYEFDGAVAEESGYGDVKIYFKYEDILIPEEIRAEVLEFSDGQLTALNSMFENKNRFYYRTVRGKSLIFDSEDNIVSWFSEDDKYYISVSTNSENFYLVTDFLMERFSFNTQLTLNYGFQNHHEVFN